MIYQVKMLRPRSIGLLLLLVTLVVYLPATSYQFISFDDPDYVTENPFVTAGLTWTGVKWAFAGAHASNWHPLTWLSHMFDCDVFRLNPAGPHLVNILFHSMNAALLFALLFRLTAKLWPSALVAALFAWHPLHVESVAWISERKDVLSTFFTLLTLLAYARHAENKQKSTLTSPFFYLWPPTVDYVLALIFFTMALLSKAMPVTLPLVMWLLDFWPLKRLPTDEGGWRSAWRLFLEKLPFLALSFIVCIVTLLAQHHAESSLAKIPFSLRMENAVIAYTSYLGKMIWPMNLAFFYPYHGTFPTFIFLASAGILIGISVIVWLERKIRPWLMVGWFWFLVTLVPVIGIVQVGGQAMADRYTYFPLVGIFVAASFSVSALAEQFTFFKKGLVAVAILALGGCAFLAEKQLPFWHDEEALSSHALAVEESEVAHITLGATLRKQNLRTEAMHHYIMALRINPESVLANVNIAGMLDETNRSELAAAYYQRAIEKNTWCPMANEYYGVFLVKQKKFPEAEKQFATAAQLDPTAATPHFSMARLLLDQGNDIEALKQLRQAVKLEPNNLEILVLIVGILAADENPLVRNGTEAHEFAERAVKLTNRRQPAVLDVLAMSCAELGRFDEAGQIQQQTIKLATAMGQEGDVPKLQKRLEYYQKHQPWRETFRKN
jgi:tetratricopeptide (TPR) repeat protein